MLLRQIGIGVLAGCVALALLGCGKEDPPKKESSSVENGSSKAAPAGQNVADTVVKGEARDVVCGMVVKAEGSKEFVYKNTRFHFCSDDCLNKFKADPAKQATGLPGEDCMCTRGEMKNCKCGHCTGKEERCDCNDPGHEEGGHEDHDHGDHDH